MTLRILGLSEYRYTRSGNSFVGKDGIFTALSHQFDVVEVACTQLSIPEKVLSFARNFHPKVDYWYSRAATNPWAFRRRTAIAEQILQAHEGQYDLIVQGLTFCWPGLQPGSRPYVLVVDNTYMLSERYCSQWTVFRDKGQRDEWVGLEQTTYQNARFVFAKSSFARQSVIQDYDVQPAKVVVIGQGVNLVAASLGEKRYDSQIALFVGIDFERKGGLVLLRAWETVCRQLPQAQLWIVGPRPPFRAKNPGVHWLGRVSNRDKLRQLYARASVFVLPSLFDPIPLACKEAMGSGLACISTDQAGVPEMVKHDDTGLLVPPGEPEPLAEALIVLLSNPARAEIMGRRAYASMQKGHSWDDVIARMKPYVQQAALPSTIHPAATTSKGNILWPNT